MVKIYKQPFAHDGDTIAIPDASQPDGKMSSADGWTPDYQLPKTDPNYKPVGRQEMNGVFKEVTEALGQVQVQGAATWSLDGAPFPANSQVYHNGKQWLALRANSVEPVEGEDWTELVGKQYVDDSKYELCEFYFWRHPYLKPGFQPATGGIVENAATLYPEAWAYLQSEEGQLLCTTEAEWQAITHAIWHINADGTQVGWNGIGGAPFYVLDVVQETLRLPDLRGMYAEAAGFDSLVVGGTHGWGVPRLLGEAYWGLNGNGLQTFGGLNFNGIFSVHDSGLPYGYATGTPSGTMTKITVDFARTTPTANKVQPRAYGVLACVYLGIPK